MLLIDIGNSRIKAAEWRAGQLSSWPTLLSSQQPDFSPWNDCAAERAVERVIVSCVGADAALERLRRFAFRTWGTTLELVRPMQMFAGFETAYREPQKLGVDRWLAALAAWREEEEAVCVVDLGTALTVDVVTRSGQHLGGLIAPGLELMRHSLTRGTAHLSSTGIGQVTGFADNTQDAISLGCISAVVGVLLSTRRRLAAEMSDAEIRWVLTGGGAEVIAPHLDWPCRYDPELVLRGLMCFAGEQ